MMGKMAKVFSTNKAINHFFCEFLAAFHKTTPFQGKTHNKIKNKNNGFPIKASIKINKRGNYFPFSQGPRGQIDI